MVYYLISMNKAITANQGFTLIELMITIAIIAILASITIPSTMNRIQRSDIAEALSLAETVRHNITFYYASNLTFPTTNEEAGIPEPDLLIGNKVTSVEVEDGAIHITLGNKASKPLQNKILSMRPAIVKDSPTSPISWLCGSDEPVPGMKVIGENKTNIDDGLVPRSCGNN